MFCRLVPGWAVYLASYEKLKDLCKFEDTRLNLMWRLNSAGIAGVLVWLVPLPFDVIKSKQMMH